MVKIVIAGTAKTGCNVSHEKPTAFKNSRINTCTRNAPKLCWESFGIILLSLLLPFALYLNHIIQLPTLKAHL